MRGELYQDSKQWVVIIGGNRGIGLGFVQHYLSNPEYLVIATYHDVEKVDVLRTLEQRYPGRIRLYHLDVRDETAIFRFAESITECIDILVLNAGIMRGIPRAYPPSNTTEEARELMEVNTYGHDNVMRALHLKLLKPHSCAVYITSTLSHSGSNVTGRSHHYRASKAAGNSLMQNWNIELARLWIEENKQDHQTRPCVFSISPGYVKTDMAGPNSNAPLTVEQSVQAMSSVIDSVRRHKQCSLYLYSGEILEHYPEPLVVSSAKNLETSVLPHPRIKESLTEASTRYLAFLNALGKNEKPADPQAISALCAENCKKVRNGQLLFEGREHFANQLNIGKEWLGTWAIDILDLVVSAESQKVVIRYALSTQKEGDLIVVIILRYDSNYKICEINEVHHVRESR